jgi:hypothetical protein
MRIRWAILGFGLIFLLSCAGARAPKNLAPEEQEFLSSVRYIISGQEKKAFLALPPSERSRFIDEFWKRRDLDPSTEVNEYKTEFLKRIAGRWDIRLADRPGTDLYPAGASRTAGYIPPGLQLLQSAERGLVLRLLSAVFCRLPLERKLRARPRERPPDRRNQQRPDAAPVPGDGWPG